MSALKAGKRENSAAFGGEYCYRIVDQIGKRILLQLILWVQAKNQEVLSGIGRSRRVVFLPKDFLAIWAL